MRRPLQTHHHGFERRRRPRGRYRRFRDRYEQRQREQRLRPVNPLRKWAHVLVGLTLVLVGPILGLLPGPGGVFIFGAGLFLLAGEFRRVAIALDHGEAIAVPRVVAVWRKVRSRLPWKLRRRVPVEPPIPEPPAVAAEVVEGEPTAAEAAEAVVAEAVDPAGPEDPITEAPGPRTR